MWVRFETYHDVTYFTPESRSAADALGAKGGWMGYVAMRAAPMGAAPVHAVHSVFYGFHVDRIHRALPEAWQIASPEAWLATRLAGVDGALTRMLGDEALGSVEVVEGAALAAQAAAAVTTAGRPLAAANAALPVPDEPHLALWQHCTVLRESRGDGHVAALTVAGLDPCESLVFLAADKGISPDYQRRARGWPEPEWRAAAERLRVQGLLAASGPETGPVLTERGNDLRRWVEDRTDAAAEAPWQHLGDRHTRRLADLLTPLCRRLAAQNDVMRPNPMGLDAASELAGGHSLRG